MRWNTASGARKKFSPCGCQRGGLNGEGHGLQTRHSERRDQAARGAGLVVDEGHDLSV